MNFFDDFVIFGGFKVVIVDVDVQFEIYQFMYFFCCIGEVMYNIVFFQFF